MARVRKMYWKEIPVQVQAEDASGQVSKPLDDRFQQGVDSISMFDGSAGTDDYLNAWEWGDYEDAEGSAEAAAALAASRCLRASPQSRASRAARATVRWLSAWPGLRSARC